MKPCVTIPLEVIVARVNLDIPETAAGKVTKKKIDEVSSETCIHYKKL